MLPQFQSSTNTFAGMSAVEAEFNQHARPGSFKAMVILTDGEWNTGGDPIAVATRMKKNGTHIFTVAVGDAATANVQSLSSLPLDKYYYIVSNEAFLPFDSAQDDSVDVPSRSAAAAAAVGCRRARVVVVRAAAAGS